MTPRPAPLAIIVAVVAVLLCGPRPAAHADEPDPIAQVKGLPGLSVLSDLVQLAPEGSGFRVTIGGASGVTGVAFPSATAGWTAALVLPTSSLTLDQLPDLGTVSATSVVVVIAQRAGSLASAELPESVKPALQPFGTAPLAAGVNVLVAGTAQGDGVLGLLGGAIGGLDVTLHGAVGADVLVAALKRAGASTPAAPAEGPIKLAVSFKPRLVPAPFTTSGDARKLFHVMIDRTTLTVEKAGGTVTFGGELAATVTVRGKAVQVDGAITVARNGDATTIALKTAASAHKPIGVDDLVGAGAVKLSVRSLGLDATFTRTPKGTSGSLGVAAALARGDGSTTTARLTAEGDSGGGIREIAVEIHGLLDLPLPGSSDVLQLKSPRLGILVAQRSAYLSGAVRWRGLAVSVAAWLQSAPAGATVFIETGKAKLSALAGGALPFDPELPATVFVASTVPLASVGLDRLPARVADMLRRLEVGTVSVGQGVALYASLDVSSLASRDALGQVGISGRMTLAGSLRVEGGKPAFDLYADLPTFKAPPNGAGKFPTPATQPRMYLSVTSGAAPAMSAGAEVAFTSWKLDGVTPIDVVTRMGVNVTSGAVALSIAGKLTRDWTSPFYLSDITIKKDTGLSFALAPESARVMMNGTVDFAGRSYGLGGGAAIQWATGIPTPKGFALRLSGDELGLIAAAAVGQTVLRAGSNLASKLVGKSGAPLPAAITGALAKARTFDLVGAVRGVVPSSGIAAELAAFSLRDVTLFLATPGMSDTNFPDLDDVGVKIEGALFKDRTRLASVEAFAATKLGFQLRASTPGFAIGPVAVRDPRIDLGAGIPGVHDVAPHFSIAGATTIKDVKLTDLDLRLSTDAVKLAGKVDMCEGKSKCIGGTVALDGTVSGATSAALTGSASLNPPKMGEVNIGAFDASITLDTKDGMRFTGSVRWEGARFAIEGGFTKPDDWSLEGSAGVDTGTKKFEVENIEIITLAVESGKISLTISPTSAKVRAKGKATINPIGLPKFGWDFDQDVTSDLRINKSVTFKLGGIEKTFSIKYKVFP